MPLQQKAPYYSPKDSDQEVTLSSVEVTLKLADLYEKVDWGIGSDYEG